MAYFSMMTLFYHRYAEICHLLRFRKYKSRLTNDNYLSHPKRRAKSCITSWRHLLTVAAPCHFCC